jgi:hypothetical protein
MSLASNIDELMHPAAGSDVEITEFSPVAARPGVADVDPAATVTSTQVPHQEHVRAAVKSPPSKNLLEQIAALKAEQKDLRTKKKELSQTLRNAERRRTRLRKKAKLLSDIDLLDVLRMRGSASTVQSPVSDEP